MLMIRGHAAGTTLTGTLYEPGEQAPSFSGAPDEGSSYVWVCDEFYEVDSGGAVQQIGDEEIHVAFESPMPRGFEEKADAIAAAKDHIRTQFARVGVDPGAVDIEIEIERSEGSR